MKGDVVIHNRIARLAAELTPAVFACLVSYDPETDDIDVVSISGTNTRLFAQLNTSARRAQSDWVPTISSSANANVALKTLFHRKKPLKTQVKSVSEGVLEPSLADTTFAEFKDHACLGLPIIINDEVHSALMFFQPDRFTKSEIELCRDFTERCRISIFSMEEEQRLTEEIRNLAQERRRVQTNDPLGLTQRHGSSRDELRQFEDIQLSLSTQCANRGKRDLNLTRREFDLLDTFMQSAGTALSRVQIISRVWVERNGISSNVLNVTVKNLREKLEADGEPRVIHSLRSYGYVLKV